MTMELPRHLPSPIAAPLARSREELGQRKDLQRFCLENTLSVLGAILVSELLRLYETSLEEGDDLARELEADERLKQVGVEQMSLGKWNHLIRVTGETLGTHRRRMLVPEILEVFSDKATVTLIDRMIETRNRDSHGHPIPSDQLGQELDRREKSLLDLLSRLSLFEAWRLSVLDEFSVTRDGPVFKGRDFSGPTIKSLALKIDGDPPPLREPMLVAGDGAWMPLLPLLVHAPLGDGRDEDLACFSKILDRDGGRLHYVGFRGASDLEPAEFDRQRGTSLVRRLKMLNALYAQPSLALPQAEVAWTGKVRRFEVGADPASVTVSIRNAKKSVELRDVSVVVQIPAQLRVEDRGAFTPIDPQDESTLRLVVESLAPGESLATEAGTLRLSGAEGGFVRLPAPEITFRHVRTTDLDFDEAADHERCDASERGSGFDLTVIDPQSDDPLIPLLRMSRRIVEVPESGKIVLGDRFAVEFELANVGLAPALDVDFELFPGTGLEVDGSLRHRFDLDAGDRRVVRLPVVATSPGIAEIRVSDVRYQDAAGDRRSLSCGDDFPILVRDDRHRRLERIIEACVADLHLDDEERARLDRAIGELATHVFKNAADPQADARRAADEAQFEAVVRLLRRTIVADGEANGIAIEERIVSESKPQARGLGRAQRRCVAYFAEGFPFFAIDITEAAEASIHFLRASGLDRIDSVSESPRYVTRYVKDVPLPLGMSFADLMASSSRGLGLVKRIVATCRRHVVENLVPWREAADAVAAVLGRPLALREGSFGLEFPESFAGGGFKAVDVLRSAKSGASHVCFELCSARPRSNVPREVFREWIASRVDAEFLDPPHPDPAERKASERPNRFPALRIEASSGERIASGVREFLDQGRLAFARDVLRSSERVERAKAAGASLAELIDRLDEELDSLMELPIVLREGESPLAVEIVRSDSTRRRPFDAIASIQFEDEPRLWLNWHHGMPTQGPLIDAMQAIDDWGYASSRSLKANRATWIPLEEAVTRFEALRAIVSAAVAAPETMAGVPPRLRAEVLQRCIDGEPGLADLLAKLANGSRTRASLLEEAQSEGAEARKAMLLLINNLTYQQERNHREVPVRIDGAGNDRVASLRSGWPDPSSVEKHHG